MTLAEKCFNSTMVEDELFAKVNLILGSNIEDCVQDGFIWGALDVGWDYYDCSVEVIRPRDAEFMTREQADQILALGFGQIYESCGQNARQWTKTSFGPVRAREPDDKLRLRADITVLRKLLNFHTK